jgi:hypothetical protein
MSNIKTINLADHINSAIDKINENFVEVMANAGLTEAEVIALILSEISKINDDTGFTESEIRAFLASTTLDLGGNKILFGNMYANVADLPDASAYHGMFAHVHNTGAAYFAHGGQWIELANKSDVGSSDFDGDYNSLTNRPSIPTDLDDLSDVQFSDSVLDGQVIKWDGTKWTNLPDSSSGGDGTGPSGTSSFQATIYTRSGRTSQPTTPTGGQYIFSGNDNQGNLVVPTDPDVTWSASIPAPDGDKDIWACTYRFVDFQSETDTIVAGTWSTPYLVGGPPVDADAVASYAQLSAYKRSTTELTAQDTPTGGQFRFSTRFYVAPTGWEESEYSGEGELYVSSGIATDADGDLDTSIVWSDPVRSSTGTNGRSTVEKAVYRRVTAEQYAALDNTWEEGDAFPSIPRPTGGAYIWSSDGNYFDDDGSQDYPELSSPWVSSQNSIVGQPGDVWSSVYSFSIEGDTGIDVVNGQWSDPVPQILETVSTYRKSLFTRTIEGVEPQEIDSNTVTYSFDESRFLTPSQNPTDHDGTIVAGTSSTQNWYEIPPPELDALGNRRNLWESTTLATIRGNSGLDNSLVFSPAKMVTKHAIDASEGQLVTQLTMYIRDDSENGPATPQPSDGVAFNFTDKTFTLPNGYAWSKTVPETPEGQNIQLWATVGVASVVNDPESTDDLIDNSIEWDAPEKTSSGANGAAGKSTFLLRVVTRTVNKDDDRPPTPVGGSVDFTEEGTVTMPNDPRVGTDEEPQAYQWFDSVGEMNDHNSGVGYNPSGKIWESQAVFSVIGETGTDTIVDWATPYEDHNNGEDGFTTYSGFLYKRGVRTSTFTKPPANTIDYNFGSDSFVFPVGNNYDGWYEEPPAAPTDNSKPALWRVKTLASSQSLSGTDTTLSWGDPTLYSVDPDPVTVGRSDIPAASEGYVYYFREYNSDLSESDNLELSNTIPGRPTAEEYNFSGEGSFSGGSFEENDDGVIPWSLSPPDNSNLTGTLYASRYRAFQDVAGSDPAIATGGNITFSDPFVNYSFNGLVTFQNMNQQLGDRFSASVTTIDGGKITTGSLEAEALITDSLTVKSLKGNVNTITPFSGTGYRSWGPTGDGYKELTKINLPRNTVVRNIGLDAEGVMRTEVQDISHMATINMAFSGVFATDTAYVKLEMRKKLGKETNSAWGSYEIIQIMTHKTAGGGNAWTTIPVVGSYATPVDVDVEFKISVLMRGDNGSGNTSQSRSSNNSWSGTVAGLVASTNTDTDSGSGTQDDTGQSTVSGIGAGGESLDDTAIWNEYSSYITSTTSDLLGTINWDDYFDTNNNTNDPNNTSDQYNGSP